MKIALIVGHNQDEQGAVSYYGESEFVFHSKLAAKVASYFSTNQLKVFYKHGDYVKRVKCFNANLVIELHFNAFRKPAYGCEALCLGSDDKAKFEAWQMLLAFNERFDIKSRGVRYLRTSRDRGFNNLEVFGDTPAFIFEPCFGNFLTEDSEKIIGNPDAYADFLVDYLNFCVGNADKISQNILDKMIALMRSWKQ